MNILPRDPITSAHILRVAETCYEEPLDLRLAVLASLLRRALMERFAGNPPEGIAELVTLLQRMLITRVKDGAVIDPATSTVAQRVDAACKDEPLFRVIFVLA
jgi:hypothetical protein